MRKTLPAKLIVVEGIDGAGKSTLLTNLEAALAAELPVRRVTKSTVASAHPSLTGYLTRLNDLLYKREDGVGALLGERYWLFAMASWYTALYEQVIQPTLADGVHVLLDNSPYKLVARMLVGSDVDADLVRACYAGLREPDLTVLLDVSPEVALRDGPLQYKDILATAGAIRPGLRWGRRHRQLHDSILSRSLQAMTRDGLLERHETPGSFPPSVQYRLTDACREILEALGPLVDWSISHRDFIERAQSQRRTVRKGRPNRAAS